MNSSIDALTGEFEACWRVLIDIDGVECNEKTLTFNATGWDGMMAYIKAKGFSSDQILDYSHC